MASLRDLCCFSGMENTDYSQRTKRSDLCLSKLPLYRQSNPEFSVHTNWSQTDNLKVKLKALVLPGKSLVHPGEQLLPRRAAQSTSQPGFTVFVFSHFVQQSKSLSFTQKC